MRKAGGQFKRSYPERLALVRRYLETDVTADELSAEVGVRVSTLRRWVRELRTELETSSLNGTGTDDEEKADPRQGRLPITKDI